MSFEDLPDEIIIKQLLALPLVDVLSFCSTSRRIHNICKDEYFWKLKIQKDFPTLVQEREGYNNKQWYFYLLKSCQNLDYFIDSHHENVDPANPPIDIFYELSHRYALFNPRVFPVILSRDRWEFLPTVIIVKKDDDKWIIMENPKEDCSFNTPLSELAKKGRYQEVSETEARSLLKKLLEDNYVLMEYASRPMDYRNPLTYNNSGMIDSITGGKKYYRTIINNLLKIGMVRENCNMYALTEFWYD